MSAPESYNTETPCCGYKWNISGDPGPIHWNMFNKVVQCHNCGQAYEPLSPTTHGRRRKLPHHKERSEAMSELAECRNCGKPIRFSDISRRWIHESTYLDCCNYMLSWRADATVAQPRPTGDQK